MLGTRRLLGNRVLGPRIGHSVGSWKSRAVPRVAALGCMREFRQSSRVLDKIDTHVTRESTMTPTFQTGVNVQQLDEGREASSSQKLREEFYSLAGAFGGIPPQATLIGMAGVLPYIFTSVSTLYLSWDINRAHTIAGLGGDAADKAANSFSHYFMIAPETAQTALQIIQPIQIGYGACIISFLGAVHWGLELAEYGGRQGIRRYGLGVLAPLLAWPSVMLPINFALITQFVGFTGIYYADSQAVSYGWAPQWYSQYRFLLTFVVGTSILFTLIVKGWIGESEISDVAPTLRMKQDAVQAYGSPDVGNSLTQAFSDRVSAQVARDSRREQQLKDSREFVERERKEAARQKRESEEAEQQEGEESEDKDEESEGKDEESEYQDKSSDKE